MKQVKVVGAIIINEGRILCAQRGETKTLAKLWEFPGGKIERNETPHQALARELREELMIEVDIQSEKFEETSYFYDFGLVNLTTYICLLKKGEPRLTEHIEVKWLKPAELTDVEWAPADIPAVKKLMREM